MPTNDNPQTAMVLTEDEWADLAEICQQFVWDHELEHLELNDVDERRLVLAHRILDAVR